MLRKVRVVFLLPLQFLSLALWTEPEHRLTAQCRVRQAYPFDKCLMRGRYATE